jgi:O-antigen/teichoic acid export membrane protein
MLEELKLRSLSGVKWTTVAAVVAALLQIAQFVVLTRFLSLTEYGVWGILAVLIGFSYVFIDMGLSNAIIHFQKIEKEELSSLYWLNVIAGISIFLVLCVLSPFLAGFYKTEALLRLIPIVALTFLIIPFGQQYQVLLQKELQFRTISLIEVVSKSLGFILMLGLLLLGMKLYAVAWSTVAAATLSSLLFFGTGKREQRPSFVLQLGRVKRFLRFGVFQMMNGTTNFFNLQIDSLLIGRLLGLEALGLYTLAKNLVLRPMFIINPIITRVTFPMMAKVQKDTALLRRTYLKTVAYLSAVNYPMYLFLAFFAGPIVALVFGRKWAGAVVLIQILSLWAALRSSGNPIGSLVQAKGRPDLEFYWNFVLLFLIPVATYISSFWRIEGVCYGQLIIQLLLTVPEWHFMVNRLCQAGFLEYYSQIVKPMALALGAAVSAFLLTAWFSAVEIHLAVALVVFGLVYWGLSKRYNPAFLKIMWEMIPKRS